MCGLPWRRSTRAAEFAEGVAQSRPFVACACGAATRPGLVLDPFLGSGTVAAVARQYGRDWLGIELNRAYLDLIEQRLNTRIKRAA